MALTSLMFTELPLDADFPSAAKAGRVLMPKMVDAAATVASSLVTVVFMVSSLIFLDVPRAPQHWD
ncbi:hypothetical protein ACOI8O_04740 [Bifidobacterium adolescentis]|uniref:hypothetical protein n=1 Tax=Bifidobacterium adolescentis TaxID=1680 RepID=UPI003D092ABB